MNLPPVAPLGRPAAAITIIEASRRFPSRNATKIAPDPIAFRVRAQSAEWIKRNIR